jgi:hypothetical protein
MSRRSPYVIDLSRQEREALEQLAGRYTLPYFLVVRAQLILWAALGRRNDEIAFRLNMRREIVSEWRKRFALTDRDGSGRRSDPLIRLRCLYDRPRPGRPLRDDVGR